MNIKGMHFLKPGAIYTLEQRCGVTDVSPYVRGMSKYLILQARGFDLGRQDYRPYIHTPSNYAVVMAVYPQTAHSMTFHFYLN